MTLFLFICISLLYPSNDDFKLQNGDLIFQEDCSENTGNTIKAVTSSIGDYHFTHVGIVYIDNNDSIFVIEATRPKVAVTPLKEYLYPQKGKGCYPNSVTGRLKTKYQHLIPKALEEALELVGRDYDDGFILNNNKYYCSELIYDILLKANNGEPVFPLNVMTFKSSETGKTTDGWIEYFKRYELPIPEGELGINPGAMSQSEVIDIVYPL